MASNIDAKLKSGGNQQAFFDQVYAEAKKLRDAGAPINPAIVAAQASLETGYGKSRLSRDANNYFGIKSTSSWRAAGGKTYFANTGEFINGKSVRENAGFRRYDDFGGCIKDYSEKVVKLPWYKNAVNNPDNPYEYAKGIAYGNGKQRWATDPAYYSKITSIARRYAPDDFNGKPEGHVPSTAPAKSTYGTPAAGNTPTGNDVGMPIADRPLNNNAPADSGGDNADLATLPPKDSEQFHASGERTYIGKFFASTGDLLGTATTAMSSFVQSNQADAPSEIQPQEQKVCPALASYKGVSSQYGVYRGESRKLHKGIDLAAPRGTPIRAVMDGVVRDVFPVGDPRGGAGGNMVVIRHADGSETKYMHMDAFNPNIKKGVPVGAGTVLGGVGNTGGSRGNHLHLEYWVDGKHKDPSRFI